VRRPSKSFPVAQTVLRKALVHVVNTDWKIQAEWHCYRTAAFV
jgi:hypothetical protein